MGLESPEEFRDLISLSDRGRRSRRASLPASSSAAMRAALAFSARLGGRTLLNTIYRYIYKSVT